MLWRLGGDEKKIDRYHILLDGGLVAKAHFTGDQEKKETTLRSSNEKTRVVHYHPIYAFEVDGVRYTGAIERGHTPVAKEFEVHYLPSNPEVNCHDPAFLLGLEVDNEGMRSSRNGMVIWGAIGILVMTGYLLLKKDAAKRATRRLQNAGRR